MALWQDVVSSLIKRVRYDDETLEIQFANGQIYAYQNVPPEEYESLMEASSPGSYFHDNIKGSYADSRVG